MKSNVRKLLICIINFVISILIIFAPTIITGHLYNESKIMGGLLTADFTMRTISLIIGLLIIFSTIQTLFKSNN